MNYKDFKSATDLKAHYRRLKGKPATPVVRLPKKPWDVFQEPKTVQRYGYEVEMDKVSVYSMAHVILNRETVRERQQFKLNHIISVCASIAQVSINELTSASRRGHLMPPRFVACYLSRLYTDAPYPLIGKALNRDHATVFAAVNRVLAELEAGNEFYAAFIVEALRRLDALEVRLNNLDAPPRVHSPEAAGQEE